MARRRIDYTDLLVEKVSGWYTRMTPNKAATVMVLPFLVTMALVYIVIVSGRGGVFHYLALYAIILSQFAFVVTMLALASFMVKRRDLRHYRDLDSIRKLRWYHFEGFVGAILELEGYVVTTLGGSQPDGGIDLLARKDGKTTIVQCKHYRSDPIPPGNVRGLYGVVKDQQADNGMLVTSGIFSEATRLEFESNREIQLVDGIDLVERIKKLESKMPEFAEREEGIISKTIVRYLEESASGLEADRLSIPACPRCRKPMILKWAPTNSERFWGCQDFKVAGCRGSRQLRPTEAEILDPDRKSKR